MRLLEVGCAAKTPLSFLRGVFGFIEQLNGGGRVGGNRVLNSQFSLDS